MPTFTQKEIIRLLGQYSDEDARNLAIDLSDQLLIEQIRTQHHQLESLARIEKFIRISFWDGDRAALEKPLRY